MALVFTTAVSPLVWIASLPGAAPLAHQASKPGVTPKAFEALQTDLIDTVHLIDKCGEFAKLG